MRRIIKYLSVNQLMVDIAAMNGCMSVKKFIVTTIIAGVGVYGACMAYRIDYIPALVIMSVAVMMIPGLVRNYFRELGESARFSDVDIYLHQMTYSFIRNPKVNIALQDAHDISSGRLRKCLERAMDELKYGVSEKVYVEALRLIEDEYDCARIRALHRFMISVEERGGRYIGAMEVLLEDFDRWVNNIYKYQAEIRKIKRDISVGIIISMVLAMLTTFMCSALNMFGDKNVYITETLAYQCVSSVFVLMCMFFYTYTRIHYGFNWLEKGRSDKQIMHDYNMVFKSRAGEITVRMIPVWIVLALTVVVFLVLGKNIAAVSVLIVTVMLIATPFSQKKRAVKRVRNDLYCGFTEWLRDLAVNLDNNPLLSAVEDTYDACPVIMKEPLEKFICDIEQNPSDIKPYYSFLSEFGVVDIQSAVRMLYSIGDLDRESMNQTINALVRRNYELSDKAESARYMDSTSVMRFSEYIPTFFVAFKMAVDMMLVVSMYL